MFTNMSMLEQECSPCLQKMMCFIQISADDYNPLCADNYLVIIILDESVNVVKLPIKPPPTCALHRYEYSYFNFILALSKICKIIKI